MHFSRNDEQFALDKVQRKNNCFVFFINTSFFERFVNLKYFLTQLMKQRRIISFINNWIFQIWYNEQMKSVINLSKRFNIDKIINVLKSQYEFDKSTIFLNIVEISQQIDVNKSKQNEIKFVLSIHLVRLLIKIEIFAKKIIIFIDYIAQKSLINCFIIDNFDELEDVKTHIVDEFQEEEFSMMIFNIVDNDRLNFFQNLKRLFFVVNRVRNDFIIVCNWKNLNNQNNAHHRSFIMLRKLRQKFVAIKLYKKRVKSHIFETIFLKAHHVIIDQTEIISKNDSQKNND